MKQAGKSTYLEQLEGDSLLEQGDKRIYGILVDTISRSDEQAAVTRHHWLVGTSMILLGMLAFCNFYGGQ